MSARADGTRPLGRDRRGAARGPAWRDRRVGFGLAIAAVSLWGLLAAWWMPRGPLTSGRALWSLALSLAVGATVGRLMRSRWAMLAAPAAFAVVYEPARVGTDGPTVDGIHASTYGILAFVVGRGFHILPSLLPLLFGATIGAGVARRLTRAEGVALHGDLSASTCAAASPRSPGSRSVVTTWR